MEISKQVQDKITNYIVKKSLDNSFIETTSQGKEILEYDFELALNDKEPKYLFVVCKKMVYQGNSLVDKGYEVYAFNKQSGEIEKDFSKKGCYYGFFNDLKILERII